MELKQLTAKIQVKFNQYSKRHTKRFPLPIQKFIRQTQFGILKSGTVQLNNIGRALQEKIPIKKTTKRLGYHLGTSDLWYQITEASLDTQQSYLKQCKYLILDLSDIQKEYAEQMDGLAMVHDGSKSKQGSGYWLCNVAGVDAKGSLIVPAYSELYSLDKESSSENAKILSAIETVNNIVGDDKICVDDRGGDRKNIMMPLLKDDRQFIIRQVGNRDLYVNGKKMPLKQISRTVKLIKQYSVTKTKKNRKIKETYYCGARKVKLTKNGKDLWLVVLKEKNKGYCWLLCHLKSVAKEFAIKTAFEGYGLRWKIEEVHRQIKIDYRLESICLQRYDALKTMNALLWSAVSFLYTRLDNICVDIVTHVELGLRNRKKWADLIRFVYYKLANALRRLLALSTLYNPITYLSDNSKQLCFELGET
ncbi:transposase [Patescibacteria group bacterium]|nr:transposase [Patescibacteria group bacterium]